MDRHNATETIDILRGILADAEQKLDPIAHRLVLAEFRRIMLRAIAEIEIKQAQDGHGTADPRDPL